MSLTNAVITSCFVVALFSAIALFQPSYANIDSYSDQLTVESGASSVATLESKNGAIANKPSALPFKDKAIIGISKRVSLNKLDDLWLAFEKKESLHNQLKTYPERVYVYYRDFSSDYGTANITVGYPADMFDIPAGKVALPKGEYQTLLKPRKYSDKELYAMWENIDFRRNIIALVEVHQLSKSGDVISSQVFIAYQQ